MNVHVNTAQFQFAHGRAPRGFGTWLFAPKRDTDALDPAIIRTPHPMNYADAKRYAVSVAKQRGYSDIYVMS